TTDELVACLAHLLQADAADIAQCTQIARQPRSAETDFPRELAIATDDVRHEEHRQVSKRLRQKLLAKVLVRERTEEHLDEVMELDVGDALTQRERGDALVDELLD